MDIKVTQHSVDGFAFETANDSYIAMAWHTGSDSKTGWNFDFHRISDFAVVAVVSNELLYPNNGLLNDLQIPLVASIISNVEQESENKSLLKLAS